MARGMIVHEGNRLRAEVQRVLERVPWMHNRRTETALADALNGERLPLLVGMQHPQPFPVEIDHLSKHRSDGARMFNATPSEQT